MASSTQQIETPAIPSLPAAGEVYSRNLLNQMNGSLKNYFIRLTTILSSIFGPRGAKFINAPYGSFQDSTNQTAANTTTAYAVTFNTTDFSNGITLSNSSHINVSQAGLYNYQFSIQFKNTSNDNQDFDIWFMKNGSNIANSNSRFNIHARKSNGDPSHLITAMNFFVDMQENDYIQLMWRTTDIGVSIEALSASTSPTRPAIPSVIATMSFVSNISA